MHCQSSTETCYTKRLLEYLSHPISSMRISPILYFSLMVTLYFDSKVLCNPKGFVHDSANPIFFSSTCNTTSALWDFCIYYVIVFGSLKIKLQGSIVISIRNVIINIFLHVGTLNAYL